MRCTIFSSAYWLTFWHLFDNLTHYLNHLNPSQGNFISWKCWSLSKLWLIGWYIFQHWRLVGKVSVAWMVCDRFSVNYWFVENMLIVLKCKPCFNRFAIDGQMVKFMSNWDFKTLLKFEVQCRINWSFLGHLSHFVHIFDFLTQDLLLKLNHVCPPCARQIFVVNHLMIICHMVENFGQNIQG